MSFRFQTNQGIKNLTPDQADILAGKNPDYSIQDLYESIASGNFVRIYFISYNFFIINMEFNAFNVNNILLEFSIFCIELILIVTNLKIIKKKNKIKKVNIFRVEFASYPFLCFCCCFYL